MQKFHCFSLICIFELTFIVNLICIEVDKDTKQRPTLIGRITEQNKTDIYLMLMVMDLTKDICHISE